MEPDSNILLSVIILIVLVLVNAFFSMSEIAIISINQIKIKKLAEDGNKNAKTIIKITASPSDFLATIQVGVTLSGLLSSAVAAQKFSQLLVKGLDFIPINKNILGGIALVIITLVLSYFTLIFGELVPKRIGMKYSEKIALGVAGFIWQAYKVTKPFVVLLSASTNGILMILGIKTEDEEQDVTEEDILMMVESSSEDVIEYHGQNMIKNIFDFEDKSVDEIMIHRTSMSAVSVNTSISDFLAFAEKEGYSRIPVYKNNIDDIIGVVYVKDLIVIANTHEGLDEDLVKFTRKPIYIPETMKCSRLLRMFQEKKIHMAIVIDEHGGTSGVVTMEDLLEIIVGNIQDEYDNEEQDIKVISPSTVIFDGNVSIVDVEKTLGVDLFDESNCETIGGYVIDCLGKIPKKGENSSIVVNDEYTVSVLDANDKRILKIKIEKKLID